MMTSARLCFRLAASQDVAGLLRCALPALLLASLLVWPALPAFAASTAGPPQPTVLAAQHRSGQTFLTWSERTELTAERYRIYRHIAPIGAANLHAWGHEGEQNRPVSVRA